jgi:hypothetical protein
LIQINQASLGEQMSTLQLNIENADKHSRLSVFFRPFLALPHVIVGGIWGFFVAILNVIQWIRILITGSRSEGLWNKQNRWLSYATRVKSYQSYLFDAFPAFGSIPKKEPVAFNFDFSKDAKRLSAFFRFLIAIPAMFVLFFLSIGAGLILIVVWFALMITGRYPSGMFAFVKKYRQFSARLSAYLMYMTDQYPKSA